MDSRLLLRRLVRVAGALLALAAALPSVPGHGGDRHRHAAGTDRMAVEAIAVHAEDEVHVEASSTQDVERCALCARLAPGRAALGRSLPSTERVPDAGDLGREVPAPLSAGAPLGAVESRGPPAR
jgi:hypothetical protein